jgi:hypothetical protein
MPRAASETGRLSIEIAAMETAIVRPARYLGAVPQLLRTVQMLERSMWI